MVSTLWPLTLFCKICLFYYLNRNIIPYQWYSSKLWPSMYKQHLVEMTAIVCGNNVLTHDPQSDGVAGALSLGVGGQTSIVACSVTCDTL